MNADRVIKWIDALESGNFTQGSSMLRGVHGYCCLGVGCEVSGLGRWGQHDGYCFPFLYHDAKGRDTVTIGNEIRSYYGLNQYQVDTLIGMNDCGGADFATIALYLRDELDKQ